MEFEIVIPLGSGKKKHKHLGFSLSPSLNRIDPVLTVYALGSFVQSEWPMKGLYARKCIFLTFNRDLELNDIHCPDRKNITDSLFCIVGDNLLSQMVGGFIERFFWLTLL